MSVLFAKRKRSQVVQDESIKKPKEISSSLSVSSASSPAAVAQKLDALRTFEDLGICEWLSTKCTTLGVSRPTAVQTNCIPPIISGKDVLGCARTGSGKTAAFALPILHSLCKDPYGPFAVVLTPTRELAYQIHDQFIAFGSSINVKSVVIVGGVDMLSQSMKLDSQPHVIVATPGRLRDHLTRATPPVLRNIAFLVLDEADRLLTPTYASDLNLIISHCNNKDRRRSYQTLLFSATMLSKTELTPHLKLLRMTDVSSLYRYNHHDDTSDSDIATVDSLSQKYIFVPSQVKTTYLAYLLSNFLEEESTDSPSSSLPKGRSVIVFVATCHMCQLMMEMLNDVLPKFTESSTKSVVALHSMMSQSRRMAALGKFKSGVSRVILCTDVASRGLDIQTVDCVINFDLPREATDYIHRVGRTARMGKSGLAISIVSQYDIEVFQNIEGKIKRKMDLLALDEAAVLKRLNTVTVAVRAAKMRLADYGFTEKAQRIRNRRRSQKKK